MKFIYSYSTWNTKYLLRTLTCGSDVALMPFTYNTALFNKIIFVNLFVLQPLYFEC